MATPKETGVRANRDRITARRTGRASGNAADAIRKRIQGQRTRKFDLEHAEGRRLTKAKRAAAEGRLAALRRVSGTDEWLMLADLTPADLSILRSEWHPDWEQANRPWGQIAEVHLWRCSSAVLGVGGQEHEGENAGGARRNTR